MSRQILLGNMEAKLVHVPKFTFSAIKRFNLMHERQQYTLLLVMIETKLSLVQLLGI